VRELRNLERVRDALPDDFHLGNFNLQLIERLAGLTSNASTQSMMQFGETKRMALLLCWLWRARSQMVDTALIIGNELIAGVFRRARNAFEREQKKQQKRIGSVLKMCNDVIKVLLDKRIPDGQLRAELFARYSREHIDGL